MNRLNYGWIKVDGYSYMCRIIDFNSETKRCEIELGGHNYWDVPFDELQPVYNSKLPWE